MSVRLVGDWAPGSVRVEPLSWPDLVIVNLEGPVCKTPVNADKIPKAGPHLHHASLPTGQPTRFVYSIANNHIMDYGVQGLRETIDTIDSSGAKYCGAGANLIESRIPLLFPHDGLLIGVVSCCEKQFGIATDNQAGACPIDYTIIQSIRELSANCDLTIVSLHAAAEMSPWPSPARQDLCRSLIDAGATVVHGHHSHIPQGWERYNGGLIFYGLGNFCVDPSSWSATPNALWSITPRLHLTEAGIEAEILTSRIVSIGKDAVEIVDASGEHANAHLQYLEICNGPLTDRLLLHGIWQEVSINLYNRHFGPWLRQTRSDESKYQSTTSGLRKLASRAKRSMEKYVYKTRGRNCAVNNYEQMLWYHLFACESHSSAISTALGVMSGLIDDLRSLKTKELVTSMVPD